MSRRRRHAMQRQSDGLKVAQMYLEGATLEQIGELLGVSSAQICLDIKRLKQQWKEEYAAAAQEILEESLAKLQCIEREYWLSWYKSQEKRIVVSEKIDAEGTVIETTTTTTELQPGNPAFLHGVMKTMWKSLELRGAIAELQNKLPLAAAKTLKTAGYSVAEPGSSNAAIALNFLVTSKLVPESIVVGLLAAIRNSEDVLAKELAKVFSAEEDEEE